MGDPQKGNTLKFLAIFLLLALSGCSSFHLGGVAYCPWGMACSFQIEPQTLAEPAASPLPALGTKATPKK